MDDRSRRRLEAIKRSVEFYNNNTADFPIGSIGHGKFISLSAVADLADTAAGSAASANSEAATGEKGLARENLVELATSISDTAKAIEPDYPGTAARLHLKRGLNDADLIARCRAIFTDSVGDATNLEAYGLSATVRDQLKTATDAFQDEVDAQSTATESRVGANAELTEHISTGMQLKRTLDAIVRNTYNGVPAKIASWHSASHVEADPKKPTPPGP